MAPAGKRFAVTEPQQSRVRGAGVWSEILQLFVGAGHYLHIATVCREWRSIYSANHSKESSTNRAALSAATVQWALDSGCPKSKYLARSCAAHGILAALQCVVAGGCAMDTWSYACAAGGGHLEVLQWARAHGCEWDGHACTSAARNGHLHVLEWAQASALPWYPEACVAAVPRAVVCPVARHRLPQALADAVLRWIEEHRWR